jgi:hypothetical protein
MSRYRTSSVLELHMSDYALIRWDEKAGVQRDAIRSQ